MASAYHRTTAAGAAAILREGFRDATGTWGTGREFSGVWITLGRPWDLMVDGVGAAAPRGHRPARPSTAAAPSVLQGRFGP